MASMVDCKCKWCKAPMRVRAADRARGWGKFCSKSCKAKEQEKRTGQHAKHQDKIRRGTVERAPMGRADGLLAALNRKRIFMVMVDDNGKEYIDPEDDGFPEDDF